MKSLAVVLVIFIANAPTIFAQISCSYFENPSYGYSCKLRVNNPNGLNNFTEIDSRHMPGYSDEDVAYASMEGGYKTLNFPSIICDTFRNLKRIYSDANGIERIDDYSFRHCSELIELKLYRNRLFYFHENAFAGNSKLKNLMIQHSNFTDLLPARLFEPLTSLTSLYITDYKFEDLPEGIFSPLTNLSALVLTHGPLKIVHSKWFGQLPKLTNIHLDYNQIFAFDEKIIDNTRVNWINMAQNVCFNGTVADSVETRNYMRYKLENCIENYQNLVTGGSTPRTTSVQPSTTVTTKATTSTTTTAQTFPPGDCRPENIDTRVCEIEAKNEEILKNVSELSESNRELKIEVQQLLAAIEDQNSKFKDEIRELERQIIELTNRPCSCF